MIINSAGLKNDEISFINLNYQRLGLNNPEIGIDSVLEVNKITDDLYSINAYKNEHQSHLIQTIIIAKRELAHKMGLALIKNNGSLVDAAIELHFDFFFNNYKNLDAFIKNLKKDELIFNAAPPDALFNKVKCYLTLDNYVVTVKFGNLSQEVDLLKMMRTIDSAGLQLIKLKFFKELLTIKDNSELVLPFKNIIILQRKDNKPCVVHVLDSEVQLIPIDKWPKYSQQNHVELVSKDEITSEESIGNSSTN